MARILLIDDDEQFLTLTCLFLRAEGHQVLPLTKGDTVLEEIRSFKPDLAIVDILMKGVMGDLVYETIRREIGCELPIIMCTATRMRLRRCADPLLEHFPKPFEFKELSKVIERLLAAAESRKQQDS